jgi:hypothetical protein
MRSKLFFYVKNERIECSNKLVIYALIRLMGRTISNLKCMYASNENWLMLYQRMSFSGIRERARKRKKRVRNRTSIILYIYI